MCWRGGRLYVLFSPGGLTGVVLSDGVPCGYVNQRDFVLSEEEFGSK